MGWAGDRPVYSVVLELLYILQSDPSQTQAVRRLVMLLLLFAVIGIVLVTCVALVFVLRRRRTRKSKAGQKRVPTESVDAWAEAGRRAVVPDEEDDEDGDEDDDRGGAR